MQDNKKIENYLSEVKERLTTRGFQVNADVVYRNHNFRLVARGRAFHIEHLAILETFFILAEFQSLDKKFFKRFSKDCLWYARKSKTIPFPCIFLNTALCFPVALVHAIDAATAEAIRTEKPPVNFSDYEVPVVYDCITKKLHYSERNPYYAQAFYDGFRDMIQNMLSP